MDEAKPKRRWFVPQFGLRLMLLVVALAATIFGWRAAVDQIHQGDRMGDLRVLKMAQRALEARIEKAKRMIQEPDSDTYTHQYRLRDSEERLAKVKKQIEELSK